MVSSDPICESLGDATCGGYCLKGTLDQGEAQMAAIDEPVGSMAQRICSRRKKGHQETLE